MFCENCDKRARCKEVCKDLNKYLNSQGIFTSNYIRPQISSKERRGERDKGIYHSKWREIPFSSLKRRDKDGEFTPS